MKSKILLLIVALLLLQLFIRAHNITIQPAFVDEYSHLRRASVIYDFEQHPAKVGAGKFFFYFLPGIFNLNEIETALYLSRTIVALVSLITSALAFAIGKRLFDTRTGLLAMTFYIVVPFAFFYERLALADSFAGLLGMAAAWFSILLAENPTRKRAILVGAFAAMAPAAKLTMIFVTLFPVAAVLFLGHYENLRDAFKKYMPGLVISGGTFILLWLPVALPALWELGDETSYVFLDSSLVDTASDSQTIPQKIEELGFKMQLLVSIPMAVLLVGVSGVMMIRYPRKGGFLLSLLLLVWIPSIIVIKNLQTRYVMSGMAIVAIGYGAGIYATLEKLHQSFFPRLNHSMQTDVVVGILAIWGIFFWIPIAHYSMTDPSQIRLPYLDERNYFWDRFNAYGSRDALIYLQEHGERGADNQVHVVPMLSICSQLDLHKQPNVTVACTVNHTSYPRDLPAIKREQLILDLLNQGFPVYVLSEYVPYLGQFNWSKPDDMPIEWGEPLITFDKPRGIQRVTLWRVTLSD